MNPNFISKTFVILNEVKDLLFSSFPSTLIRTLVERNLHLTTHTDPGAPRLASETRVYALPTVTHT
jgi:hypothetical protein